MDERLLIVVAIPVVGTIGVFVLDALPFIPKGLKRSFVQYGLVFIFVAFVVIVTFMILGPAIPGEWSTINGSLCVTPCLLP